MEISITKILTLLTKFEKNSKTFADWKTSQTFRLRKHKQWKSICIIFVLKQNYIGNVIFKILNPWWLDSSSSDPYNADHDDNNWQTSFFLILLHLKGPSSRRHKSLKTNGEKKIVWNNQDHWMQSSAGGRYKNPGGQWLKTLNRVECLINPHNIESEKIWGGPWLPGPSSSASPAKY